MTDPRQYGGHKFEWDGSGWLLPQCSRCGRRAESKFDKDAPHNDAWQHSPPHPNPCDRLGHQVEVYPVCEGNKLSVLIEERERATIDFERADRDLKNALRRVAEESRRVDGLS